MKPLAMGAPLLVVLLTGCAPHKYHPVSISPAATAAALYSRSLDDPDLDSWMTQRANSKASSWPLQAWNLESLTLAAYYFNPDLDIARATAATADAAITTAAMKPNPSVSVGPGYQGPEGSQPIAAFDFSLPIETAGKRGYRIANASHMSAASRFQLGQTAWVVRSRVRVTLVEYLFAVQAADLLRRETELRKRYVRLTEARFRAGEVPLPDLTTVRIDLTSLHQTLSTAEGQVLTTHAALAAAIGVPDSALAGKMLVWNDADRPPAPDLLPTLSVRKLALENRLDVRRALEQYEAAQSGLQLEIARQYPDFNIGPGYSYEEGTNFLSLVVSGVLPIRNRNEGPIAEAEAQRKAAGAQLLAVQSTVLADVDRSRAQYAAAFAALEGATTAVVELKKQERSAVTLLNAGETERLTVVAAQLQTSVSERARLDALHQAQISLGLVEDALQQPLEAGNTLAFPQIAPRP
jgi:cobalt-zinc-cadmium efflux system outer membrane protein